MAPTVTRPKAKIGIEPPAEALTEGEPFFCTDAKHPSPAGSATPLLDMFDLERVFYVEPGALGCPTCPACKRQTSSIPIVDATSLPPSLQTLKERLDAAQHA